MITDEKGDPWFVAKDVCGVLGLDTSNLSKVLDVDEFMTVHYTVIGGAPRKGNPNDIIINEPGLYSLILRSRKPEARAFKRWITHEVLPQIRKAGGYGMAPENAQLFLLLIMES